MNLFLTRGMFGKHIKTLAKDVNDVKEILSKIYCFKTDENNMNKYKIEKYNRYISDKDCIAIDFGDYSYFLEISNISKKQLNELINVS